jgi:hypothetical protein
LAGCRWAYREASCAGKRYLLVGDICHDGAAVVVHKLHVPHELLGFLHVAFFRVRVPLAPGLFEDILPQFVVPAPDRQAEHIAAPALARRCVFFALFIRRMAPWRISIERRSLRGKFHPLFHCGTYFGNLPQFAAARKFSRAVDSGGQDGLY